MTDAKIHAPQCPKCDREGIELIVSEHSAETSRGGDPWFEVVFCSACGHVYGVFPKIVLSPSPPSIRSTPPIAPPRGF